MVDDERDLLLASEKEALDVLLAANSKAERIIREAEDDAVRLMRKQQDRAKRLIAQAQDAASQDASADDNTSAVLEAHKAAAEMLGATERELAETLSATRSGEAVDVLMAGHREASAILLSAWMQVSEGQHSDR